MQPQPSSLSPPLPRLSPPRRAACTRPPRPTPPCVPATFLSLIQPILPEEPTATAATHALAAAPAPNTTDAVARAQGDLEFMKEILATTYNTGSTIGVGDGVVDATLSGRSSDWNPVPTEWKTSATEQMKRFTLLTLFSLLEGASIAPVFPDPRLESWELILRCIEMMSSPWMRSKGNIQEGYLFLLGLGYPIEQFWNSVCL